MSYGGWRVWRARHPSFPESPKETADAFHLVIPSMPGYGFSGKPTTAGWGPERIARA
jgi:hypothetical protein